MFKVFCKETFMEFFLNCEIFSCIFMCGVIWIVQLVHYPSFYFVDTNKFEKFEHFHQKNVTFIVLPMMCLELFSNIINMVYFKNHLNILDYFLSFLLFTIWAITFFACIPCHRILSNGSNIHIIDKLITFNWYRTILWSMRAVLLLIYSH